MRAAKTTAAKRSTKRGRASRSPARPKGVTFADVIAAGGRLPGVEQGLCYGTPALRVKGKFLLRLKEDGETVAIKVPMEDRDLLLEIDPHVFYITDHYRDYPAILFRLARIDRDRLADLLELGWRFVAPKRLAQALEATREHTRRP